MINTEFCRQWMEKAVQQGLLTKRITRADILAADHVETFHFALGDKNGDLCRQLRRSSVTETVPFFIEQAAERMHNCIDFYTLDLAKEHADHFDNLIIDDQDDDWLLNALLEIAKKMNEAMVPDSPREIVVPKDWEDAMFLSEHFHYGRDGLWLAEKHFPIMRITPSSHLKDGILAMASGWAYHHMCVYIDKAVDGRSVNGHINVWYTLRGGRNDVCFFDVNDKED